MENKKGLTLEGYFSLCVPVVVFIQFDKNLSLILWFNAVIFI